MAFGRYDPIDSFFLEGIALSFGKVRVIGANGVLCLSAFLHEASMVDDSYRNLCIFHTLDGLREGLTHYSGQSRAALIYAVDPDDPIRVYDPQDLLQGHEPKFKELYLDSEQWRHSAAGLSRRAVESQIHPLQNLGLAGLISWGGRSLSIFYQMWFTEHHPDMCSIGPTERWLEHAAWLLSHDFATKDAVFSATSGYVLREYATHAVRDYLVDQTNLILGWDTSIRIYPILDAVLGTSKTREEGAWPRGELIFVEPRALRDMDFLAHFPDLEQPSLQNYKHVRKLLLAVENSRRALISDGRHVVGISTGDYLPGFRITADFRGRHGFLKLNGDLVCSFSNGSFQSSNHRANLVQLEEVLLESSLDPDSVYPLYRTIAEIVNNATKRKHGCTLVIDLNQVPLAISGQQLDRPLDLNQPHLLALAQSLAMMDGALHIGRDMQLHAFACLLDGRRVPAEDRARGARFNSALRFTAVHKDIIVVVVSADRPVSVIQEGVELNARCELQPVSGCLYAPPMLKDWLSGECLEVVATVLPPKQRNTGLTR